MEKGSSSSFNTFLLRNVLQIVNIPCLVPSLQSFSFDCFKKPFRELLRLLVFTLRLTGKQHIKGERILIRHRQAVLVRFWNNIRFLTTIRLAIHFYQCNPNQLYSSLHSCWYNSPVFSTLFCLIELCPLNPSISSNVTLSDSPSKSISKQPCPPLFPFFYFHYRWVITGLRFVCISVLIPRFWILLVTFFSYLNS